jgi:hypothetical protein
VPETPRIAAVHPELQRLIRNWLLAYSAGALKDRLGMCPEGPYSTLGRLVAPDARMAPSVPFIQLDSDRVERAVKSMPGKLRQVFVAWWCWHESVDDRAKRLRMRRAKFLELVTAAHGLLHERLLGCDGVHSARRDGNT